MKKVFIILSLLLCEVCFAQRQSVYITLDRDILYEESTIDQAIKQILSFDSPNTIFKVYSEENDYQVYDKLLRMHQYCGEYRIMGGDILVHIKDDKIARINGKYYSSLELINKGNPLSESEILTIAEKFVFATSTNYEFQHDEIEKVISENIFDGEDKKLHYACKILVTDKKNVSIAKELIIDESTGMILNELPQVWDNPLPNFPQKSYSWGEASLGIFPEKPTTEDEIVLQSNVIINTDFGDREYIYDLKIDETIGNDIYCKGLIFSTKTTLRPGDVIYSNTLKNDSYATINLGKLPLGNYVVHLTINDLEGKYFNDYEDLNLTFEFSVQNVLTAIVDNHRKHQQNVISPNPVKDILHLTLPTASNSIQIIDMQGKLVLQTECGETANIHVSMLPKGVYTLVVNGTESQKFVKE